jgi:hypothetical protein
MPCMEVWRTNSTRMRGEEVPAAGIVLEGRPRHQPPLNVLVCVALLNTI